MQLSGYTTCSAARSAGFDVQHHVRSGVWLHACKPRCFQEDQKFKVLLGYINILFNAKPQNKGEPVQQKNII